MATTTANKHGLRAAATERRNRHAQRTPLPPRAGTVETVLQAVKEQRKANLEPKGFAKAQAFAVICEKAGWKTEITGEGDLVEVVARRASEAIHQAWTEGVYHNASATYTVGDRTVMTRNLASARRLAERAPAAATAELERVASNKAFRRRETSPARMRLPFDPTTASDKDIVDALAGKGVAWHNRFRQTPETALMSRDPRAIRIEEQNGERVVLFCCPATGFRAFRLSALTRVGKGRGPSKGQQVAEVVVEG